jgi:tetratricopeptide (TPR) repeat protein
MYRPGILRGLGLSFYLLGQTDQAVRAFKESITREPEYLSAYTHLASIYGEIENLVESKAIVSDIKRLAPEFSVKAYMTGLSYSDSAVLDRVETGLRKAGLKD